MKNKEDYSKYECPYSHIQKECGHDLKGPEGYQDVYGIWCACGFRGPVFCLDPKELNLQLKDTSSSVLDIFLYWCVMMNKSDSVKLTPKRKSCIKARLKEGYTVDQIKQAVDGCARSPHHMGKNDTGTIYDDLTLICRSGDKLEFFINNVCRVINNEKPKRESFAERSDREIEQVLSNIRAREERAADLDDNEGLVRLQVAGDERPCN